MVDQDANLRLHAAHSLGLIGNEPGVVDALIKTLLDPEPRVRANAVQSLGNLGSAAKSAIPYLKKHAERDKDGVVKKFSRHAIAQIEGGE